MGSLGVYGKIEPHCELFVNSLKSTHWACGDHMGGHFLKEPLMGGLGSLMGTLQGTL
jgi:hypothetical protein